jgi:hypothetical protein
MYFDMKINQINNVKNYLKVLGNKFLNIVSTKKRMHVRSRFFMLILIM